MIKKEIEIYTVAEKLPDIDSIEIMVDFGLGWVQATLERDSDSMWWSWMNFDEALLSNVLKDNDRWFYLPE